MRFTLDVIRARKGDCLMVHYGTKTQPTPDDDRRRTVECL